MSKIALFIFGLFLLPACSLPIDQIGDVPSVEKITLIQMGMHKDEVQRLWGSPAHITLFKEEGWIYVASKEQRRGFLPPNELERKVIAVTFDDAQKVKSVRQFALNDAVLLPYDSEIVESKGKELSIWEEMVGNFGRFPSKEIPQQ